MTRTEAFSDLYALEQAVREGSRAKRRHHDPAFWPGSAALHNVKIARNRLAKMLGVYAGRKALYAAE